MNIVDCVCEIVKKDILDYKNSTDDHYDFWREHIQYVYKESRDLAIKYNADLEIVSLGALLHDIALIRKVGTKKDHHINGRNIADEILTGLGYLEDKKNKVLDCVYNHRSSKNGHTLEERCVADADILAHFDNIPMLFHSLLIRKKVPLEKLRNEMSKVLLKDYNDLSDEIKKEYKEKFQNMYYIIVGEKYE